MIIEQRRLFFKTASIILDDNKIQEVINSGVYSSIVILSYKQMKLPGFHSFSKPTLLIDLTRSKEDILREFNNTTRNEIRRSYKIDNFRVITNDIPDDRSYALYKKFEFSQGRVPVSQHVLAQTFFLGIELEDELISGLFITKSPPYLRVRSIFSKRLATHDRELLKLIGFATRRLIWEACLWGKRNDFQLLDLASVNIHNPKTENIAKFKMSFGKDLTPEFTYIYKSRFFTFFEKAITVKLVWKRIMNYLERITL